MATIHESMADLHKIGAIDDETMQEFERGCGSRETSDKKSPEGHRKVQRLKTVRRKRVR